MTRSTSQLQAHEAGLPLRTIIVEFDTYDTALAARESEAYRKALQALGFGAERHFRIVEGAETRGSNFVLAVLSEILAVIYVSKLPTNRGSKTKRNNPVFKIPS